MEDLGEFLRSRRARVRPQDVGLPDHGRRRVPGLRREELAQLAGVSVDCYVRLEQGRGANVTDAVLDSIATALQLDDDDRRLLFDLARRTGRPRHAAKASEPIAVRKGVQALLDHLHAIPALVIGRRTDVLAWNALADALHGFTDPAAGAGNLARHTFLDAAARGLYPDHAQVARETVAHLRHDHVRHPDDPRLAALVRDLLQGSEEFRRLWTAAPPSTDRTFGRRRLAHPVAGPLVLDYETLTLPGNPDQLLVTYVAADPETEERLRLLASWHAPMPDSR
jgi:transcriptional regulator with XRE-family HTH domain